MIGDCGGGDGGPSRCSGTNLQSPVNRISCGGDWLGEGVDWVLGWRIRQKHQFPINRYSRISPQSLVNRTGKSVRIGKGEEDDWILYRGKHSQKYQSLIKQQHHKLTITSKQN